MSNYILDRDLMASARLKFQHFAILQLQPWFLPPQIDGYLKSLPNPKVADLGTGNAIWVNDLADRYPHAAITGLDVSSEQFPRKSGIADNAVLEVHDLFNPVPNKYVEAYDLIHIRLTVGWIYNRDGDLLLRNILSMLKPGGYIQWEENCGREGEPSHHAIWVMKPDGSLTRTMPSWYRVLETLGLYPGFSWLQQLPKLYSQHGLIDVQTHHPEPRKSIMDTQIQSCRWTLDEVYKGMISAGVAGAREQYSEQIKTLEAELDQGLSFAYGLAIAVGRKPFR